MHNAGRQITPPRIRERKSEAGTGCLENNIEKNSEGSNPSASIKRRTSMRNGLSRDQAYRNRIAFSVPETAKIWGYGPKTVWSRIRSGKLLAARIGTRILIPRTALEKLTGPLSTLPMDKGPALISELCADCGMSDRFLREQIYTGALPVDSRKRPIHIDRQTMIDWIASHADDSGERVRPDLVAGIRERNQARRKALMPARSAV